MLQNDYLVVKIGVDSAENEPFPIAGRGPEERRQERDSKRIVGREHPRARVLRRGGGAPGRAAPAPREAARVRRAVLKSQGEK